MHCHWSSQILDRFLDRTKEVDKYLDAGSVCNHLRVVVISSLSPQDFQKFPCMRLGYVHVLLTQVHKDIFVKYTLNWRDARCE